MRSLPPAVALGLTLMCIPLTGNAESVQPRPTATAPAAADPFEQALLQMEGSLAKLRATGDPAERQRLLQEHARGLHQAMRLAAPPGPGTARPGRGASSGMPPRYMWGPGSRMWAPGEKATTRRAEAKAPEHQRGQPRRRGAPYAQLEQRLVLMQQRLDEQQRVLDEILQYREPIEELLQQRGIGQ